VGETFSAPVQTGPGAHPASCTMNTGSYPGVKSGRYVTLNPHPLLVLWSRKGEDITQPPLVGHTVCIQPQCLYKCKLYLLPLKIVSHKLYSITKYTLNHNLKNFNLE